YSRFKWPPTQCGQEISQGVLGTANVKQNTNSSRKRVGVGRGAPPIIEQMMPTESWQAAKRLPTSKEKRRIVSFVVYARGGVWSTFCT
ncbi:hypothetical protein LJD47_32325, partial [Escherichia coli]|nr:hypothetical protein [Escherichia coli]